MISAANGRTAAYPPSPLPAPPAGAAPRGGPEAGPGRPDAAGAKPEAPRAVGVARASPSCASNYRRRRGAPTALIATARRVDQSPAGSYNSPTATRYRRRRHLALSATISSRPIRRRTMPLPTSPLRIAVADDERD